MKVVIQEVKISETRVRFLINNVGRIQPNTSSEPITRDMDDPNSFCALEEGWVRQVSEYKNGLTEILIEREMELDKKELYCYSLMNLKGAVLPNTKVTKGQIIAKSPVNQERWLLFMANRGGLSESKQKSIEEADNFVRLERIPVDELRPGDILIQKVYAKKSTLDSITYSYRYFHKHHVDATRGSRFSLHVAMVTDKNKITHMNEPCCQVSDIHPCGDHDYDLQHFSYLVYRCNNQSITDSALKTAALSLEHPQSFLSGAYKEADLDTFKNERNDIFFTNCMVYQIKYLSLKNKTINNLPRTQQSWCSKFIFELFQKSINQNNSVNSQPSITQLFDMEGDGVSSKKLESLLNQLCSQNLFSVVGKTFLRLEMKMDSNLAYSKL